MSNKRIQVLHGDLDQKALEWLDAQTNMSATIRLMIHQASRGSNDDYVMKCAKESQGIFGGSSQRYEMIGDLDHGHSITTTLHAENSADVPNRLKELAETTVEPRELPEERQVSEISVEKDIPVQPEPVQTPPVQPEQKKTVDWDKMEDEKNDTISRMMADLGRN